MEIPQALLDRYFNNHVTPREARKVLRWFKTPQGQQYLKNKLDHDLVSLSETPLTLLSPFKSQSMLHHILRAPFAKKPSRSRLAQKHYMKIAAGLLALIVITGLLFLKTFQTVTYTTRYGERKEIILPDSSTVILNGNSSITLARNWAEATQREVWLKGEAFFNVYHTQHHEPFLVYASDNFNIRVLGTEFNVSSRSSTTRVALMKGNIQLNFIDKGEAVNMPMKPGELVEFNEQSAFVIKKETRVKNLSSWKEAHMIFEQTSLAEIAVMLKDTYGIKLIVDDAALLQQKISGSVPNKNLDLFLRGLAEILDVKVNREEGLVYFESPITPHPHH